MVETVNLSVDGVELQADLYLPDKIKPGERRPALVAGHGFSAVREALQPQGEYFSAAGYIVLALDYRSFGRSGGTVRGELFPDRQVEDFSAGISFLQTRDDVEGDRIGVWGTSFGGGVALAVGARDRRARVVISQVPITDPRAGCAGCAHLSNGNNCSMPSTRTAPAAFVAPTVPAFRWLGRSPAQMSAQCPPAAMCLTLWG